MSGKQQPSKKIFRAASQTLRTQRNCIYNLLENTCPYNANSYNFIGRHFGEKEYFLLPKTLQFEQAH